MDVFTQFTPELLAYWNEAAASPHTRHPFCDCSWHKTWFIIFGTGESLCIFYNRAAKSIVPLAIRDGVAHFTGGEEISDYLDRIGPTESTEADWSAVLHMLKARGATSLVLRNIPEGSNTVDFFRNTPGAIVATEDTTPRLHLPHSFDAYLETLSRKDRHELRRKVKRFESEHPEARFSVSETSDMDTLLTLMKQNPDKQAFLTTPMEQFFRTLPETAGPTLRQATLFDGNTAIATTLSFLVHSELMLYNSGYNPEVVGAGWYLKTKLIAWGIVQHITTLNFLQGSERYKYDLGAKDFPVYRIELALP